MRVGAEQFVRGDAIAAAQAKFQAAAGDEVDHRCLLGDLCGVVQRRENHCGPEPHA